ncbi:MAG: threonine aldolase family protein [Acidobacteriota bacterium]
MPDHFVDLRSDTVTRPTPRMRRAMAEAEVGDDVYGEDPTVNRLQELAAGLMRKEAALFMPSGSMANQTAVKVHTRPGDEVICEAQCHIYNIETGTMAAFSGVLPRPVPGTRGVLDPERVAAAIRPASYYLPRTSLVAAENSHNLAGGTVMGVEASRAIGEVARKNGLASHLDGARIFNAAAALGVEAGALAEPFDSVMFCISKGLSAPVGSLLCGSRAFIDEARRVRKMLGGGMRQAGILAAAGLVALEEILPLLPEDHRRARVLAEHLAAAPGFEVDLATVQTNIVMTRVKAPLTAQRVGEGLKARGVLCHVLPPDHIRFVTHHEVDDEGLARALEALAAGF